MSYAAALDHLNAMAPELFTRPGQPRRKFSLDQIRVLLDALGNPQSRFPSVLIAGTNGKGSTAATLASILTEAGVRTGLYTSPHLERVNERIRIDRTLIGDDDFARHFFKVHDTAQELVRAGSLPQIPSFFECLTALAFSYFAESGVEIAVLEVGMGGRLDATNIVSPLLSIITDISLDHMEWLGPTITDIAREKAGILRSGGTLVTLPQHPDASRVIGEVAAELDVRGISAVPYMPHKGAPASRAYPVEILGSVVELTSPLLGAHQHRNVALAVAAAVELQQHGFPITPGAIAAGVRGTSWPGRLERLQNRGLEWILDVAHNPAGAWALRAGLRDALGPDEGRPMTLLFACLRDKPLAELAQILFPLFELVIFPPIQSPRATPVEELLAAARSTGTPALIAGSVAEALALATKRPGTIAAGGGRDFSPGTTIAQSRGPIGPSRSTSRTNLVVVSGSVYLVGEARTLLMSNSEHKQEAPA
jgi:dihydrofolate synthase/folylpolyglutamate synthase